MGAKSWHDVVIAKEGLGCGIVLLQQQGCLRQVTNELHKGVIFYAQDEQAMSSMSWHATPTLRRVLDTSMVLF